MFGGLVEDTPRNDLYLISADNRYTTRVRTTGEIPSPRVGHASAVVGSVLIVWGGETSGISRARYGVEQDNGLYLLNLRKFGGAATARRCSL